MHEPLIAKVQIEASRHKLDSLIPASKDQDLTVRAVILQRGTTDVYITLHIDLSSITTVGKDFDLEQLLCINSMELVVGFQAMSEAIFEKIIGRLPNEVRSQRIHLSGYGLAGSLVPFICERMISKLQWEGTVYGTTFGAILLNDKQLIDSLQAINDKKLRLMNFQYEDDLLARCLTINDRLQRKEQTNNIAINVVCLFIESKVTALRLIWNLQGTSEAVDLATLQYFHALTDCKTRQQYRTMNEYQRALKDLFSELCELEVLLLG